METALPEKLAQELTPDSREDFERVGAETGGRETESEEAFMWEEQ